MEEVDAPHVRHHFTVIGVGGWCNSVFHTDICLMFLAALTFIIFIAGYKSPKVCPLTV